MKISNGWIHHRQGGTILHFIGNNVSGSGDDTPQMCNYAGHRASSASYLLIGEVTTRTLRRQHPSRIEFHSSATETIMPLVNRNLTAIFPRAAAREEVRENLSCPEQHRSS